MPPKGAERNDPKGTVPPLPPNSRFLHKTATNVLIEITKGVIGLIIQLNQTGITFFSTFSPKCLLLTRLLFVKCTTNGGGEEKRRRRRTNPILALIVIITEIYRKQVQATTTKKNVTTVHSFTGLWDHFSFGVG